MSPAARTDLELPPRLSSPAWHRGPSSDQFAVTGRAVLGVTLTAESRSSPSHSRPSRGSVLGRLGWSLGDPVCAACPLRPLYRQKVFLGAGVFGWLCALADLATEKWLCAAQVSPLHGLFLPATVVWANTTVVQVFIS